MPTTINVRFKLRRKTAANWTSTNEVLLEGEMGLETDTRQFKFGDGSTAWNSLAYASTGAVTSVAGRTGAVTLAKGDVGLGSVDNTSDAAKPVSTAQQTALDLKANLASPEFSGNVGVGTTGGASFKLTIRTAAATAARALDIGGSTTSFSYASWSNTGGSLWWGIEGSAAAQIFGGSLAYASLLGSSNATALQLGTSGAVRLTIMADGKIIAPLPTYADNAAAVTAGLAADTLYKTATGEVRIRV